MAIKAAKHCYQDLYESKKEEFNRTLSKSDAEYKEWLAKK